MYICIYVYCLLHAVPIALPIALRFPTPNEASPPGRTQSLPRCPFELLLTQRPVLGPLKEQHRARHWRFLYSCYSLRGANRSLLWTRNQQAIQNNKKTTKKKQEKNILFKEKTPPGPSPGPDMYRKVFFYLKQKQVCCI